jgi:hypothetical protein
LATPKGRVLAQGSALLEEHENFNTNFSFRLIWRPNRSKWKFLSYFGKSVEVKICFIFGRPLGAGLGPGTCPSKQKEIINDEQFTLINLAAPWGRVVGGGLPN